MLALISPEQPSAPLGRLLAVSLALHLAFFVLVVGVRWMPRAERLQTTYHVSLVSLPTPVVPEPVQAAEPPPPQARQPEPPPLASKQRPSAPVAAPVPKMPQSSATSEATKRADDRLRQALLGIERPPEAPRLGDYRPPTAKHDPERVLGTLPDVPLPAQPRDRQPEPSLSESVSRQLEEFRRSEPKVATTKPAAIKKPVTAIRAPGASSGFDRYLALVQSKISAMWVAPPVDLTGRSFQVIIRFRLHRTGGISEVVIERPSGNGYYDDAGKRAVLSADPLPPFPPEISEKALDTHFSFTVGAEAG